MRRKATGLAIVLGPLLVVSVDAWQLRRHDNEPWLFSSSAGGIASTRRNWLAQAGGAATTAAAAAGGAGGWWCWSPERAHALVKGVSPPPSRKKVGEQRAQCRNIEECQAKAEERERQQQLQAAASDEQDGDGSDKTSKSPVQTTAGGVRYRDLVVPKDGDTGGAVVVKVGDQVELQYKVLKLGKRSYDGLSGEGTVVFSRGYGLEDDESRPGEMSFSTVVGSYSNIAALNEALVGMRVGGTRRFSVLPQLGWRRPSRECDGGPGGSGTGGDIKTDFVVVPTAQLVAEEACFDQTKQPFPASYAQQRRMAQRFDQSLIMEVQVVSTRQSTDDLL